MLFYNDEEKILAWLKEHNVANATLEFHKSQKQIVVNIDGNVNLNNKKLTSIPVKFGRVTGSFIAINNSLTSLHGSPYYVKKRFSVSFNDLLSLEGSPQSVGENYCCTHNKNLTNLKGITPKIRGQLLAQDNNINSVQFLPQTCSLVHLERNPHLAAAAYITDLSKLKEIQLIEIENKNIAQCIPIKKEQKVEQKKLKI